MVPRHSRIELWRGLGGKSKDFWLPKPSKIELWRGLGGGFGEPWDVLGSLGASWARLGRALGASWSVRGRLGGVLRPSWDVLGGSWRAFGESWRLSGTILGAFLKDFLPSRAIYENSNKPRKTNGFTLIFEVLGGFWGSENQKNRYKIGQRG